MVVLNNLKVYTIPNRVSSFLVGGNIVTFAIQVSASLTCNNYNSSTISSYSSASGTGLDAFKIDLIASVASSVGLSISSVIIITIQYGINSIN